MSSSLRHTLLIPFELRAWCVVGALLATASCGSPELVADAETIRSDGGTSDAIADLGPVDARSDHSDLMVDAPPPPPPKPIVQELGRITVNLRLGASNRTQLVGGLPPGAIYDADRQRVLWIPQIGQRGEHTFEIRSIDPAAPLEVERQPVTIKVRPTTDEVLRDGPPPAYVDGDVGFVFVHGKGDADRCQGNLTEAYWVHTPTQLAPDPVPRTLACYDGREPVEVSAPQVANQILAANCGTFKRCVVVTHSMGGLVLNHILTHARAATADDPEPLLFQHAELYKRVRERVLYVIAIASAAGGSRAADIVEDPQGAGQDVVALLAKRQGNKTPSTRSLTISRATSVLAPIDADPGVPFFMVPGHSEKVITNYAGGPLVLLLALIGSADSLFGGDAELAAADAIANYRSRSDGLVAFRSACGVLSQDYRDGPSRKDDASAHRRWCYEQPKKPNHYVWFISNLNHYAVLDPSSDQRGDAEAFFPDHTQETFSYRSRYDRDTVAEIIRKRLTDDDLPRRFRVELTYNAQADQFE